MRDIGKHLRNWELWGRPPPPPPAILALVAKVAGVWPLVIVLAGAALYLPFLDVRPLRFEEGRRALQAMEMLEGDAWWYLRVLGESYINKPPFTPWLISAVAMLDGAIDEVAVRLPGILMALIGALAAGWAASALVPADRKVAGLAAGLAFLCSIFLLLKTRVGETDVTVTALCGLAFAIWVRARWEGGLRAPHWLAIGLCFACAALCKGPIPIAFPAVAMIGVPLLQKRYHEAATALAVIVLAQAPLAWWVWDNLTGSNAGHWAVELRIAPDERRPDVDWTKLLYLNDLPLTLLYLMPFLPAAVAMVLMRRELPGERRWPVDALLLYALPMTLLTTIPPMGKARYAMPAVWPVAVLAGMWIAITWRRLYFASFLIGAGVAVAVIVQLVQIGFMDGRTSGQRAFRARADELSTAVRALPPGALPVLWPAAELNYNLLAYAGRPLYAVTPEELNCRTEDFLIAGSSGRNTIEASGRWTMSEPLSDWGVIYRRAPNGFDEDCEPAFRPRQ